MAAAAGSAGTDGPVCTVYVKNLEERIKIEPLKEALRELFGEFGTIVDIVAKKNLKAKGQAFIVYDNPESAAMAIEEIQGFELFDKPMELQPAKTRSDATVQRQGTSEEFEAHKRHRLAEKERKQALEAQEAEEAEKKAKRPQPSGPEAPATRPAKTARGAGLKSTGGAAAVVPDEYLPPNNTLFAQNLPDDYGVDELTTIFNRFDGFKEIRLVPGRKGIAFIEYENESGAISAKENTANMSLGSSSKPLKVTYQRQ